jgi:hypothetical protein
MHINRSLGWILLAVWLILTGLMQLAGLAIPAVIMGILAIAAGILILLNR